MTQADEILAEMKPVPQGMTRKSACCEDSVILATDEYDELVRECAGCGGHNPGRKTVIDGS